MTIPKADSYNIKLESAGNMDMVLWRSCAREDSGSQKKPGFFIFSGNNKTEYVYNPLPGLEDTGTCPLRIDVYEVEKGQHSWAFLEFEHPDYLLPFDLDCNGRKKTFSGVGTCQQKAGLLARVHFDEPIMFAPPEPDKCPTPKRIEKGVYKWEVGTGECLYHFKTSAGLLGKFISIGYQGVLIRGGV